MNLREVKKKVKSVKNVKKITKAMQLVSAVKMKKAQQKAMQGKDYRDALKEAVQKVVNQSMEVESLYMAANSSAADKGLYIVISSDKGLCGGFLGGLHKKILTDTNVKADGYITVGKKASQFIASLKGDIVADFEAKNLTNRVSAILGLAIDYFKEGKCKEVYVLYNKFISTLKLEPVMEKIFPLSMEKLEESLDENGSIYKIEPDPKFIFDQVLRDYIEEKLRGALLSSEAAEHSARMIAMKNATDNANEVIYNLTLVGNKLRQENITNELLDMITAKESVDAS
jgi:F-type H+-transporting ATPase subunit gamma